jgi:hypothetical protein
MSKWQFISLVLAGLLFLSCLGLATVGVLWVTSSSGGNVLAAMTGRIPPPVPSVTARPRPRAPLVAIKPKGGKVKGVQAVGAFGIVSAVNDSSVTVSGPRGASRTLAIGNETRVIVVGILNATVRDIEPGDKILVLGLKDNAGSMEPRALIAAPADFTRANVIVGKIESASGQSLSLQTRAGTLTVALDGNTQIYTQALQTAQASDLTAGGYVIVLGQAKGAGAFAAQLVLARMGGTGGGQQNGAQGTPTPTPGP